MQAQEKQTLLESQLAEALRNVHVFSDSSPDMCAAHHREWYGRTKPGNVLVIRVAIYLIR